MDQSNRQGVWKEGERFGGSGRPTTDLNGAVGPIRSAVFPVFLNDKCTRGPARSLFANAGGAPTDGIALKAHAFRSPEARDDASLDFLAGFASGFARPPILPPRLIKVGNKSVPLNGCRF